jgi:hypothetical protein
MSHDSPEMPGAPAAVLDDLARMRGARRRRFVGVVALTALLCVSLSGATTAPGPVVVGALLLGVTGLTAWALAMGVHFPRALGDRGASAATIAVALGLAVLPAMLGSAVAWASAPHGPPGDCFAYGTVVGVLTLPLVYVAGLGGLLRRRGPTLVYVLVGASALALVPVSLQCPDYTFAHLAQGHATLLIAFGGVGLVGDAVRRRVASTR